MIAVRVEDEVRLALVLVLHTIGARRVGARAAKHIVAVRQLCTADLLADLRLA